MILTDERLVRVGQTRKSHGVDGAFRLEIDAAYGAYVLDAAFLFLDVDGDKVPFRVEYIRGDEEAPIAKLEWVDTPEEASDYAGLGIFLEKKYLPPGGVEEMPSELEYGYLTGYTLFDEKAGLVGRILEVEMYPQQEIAVVNYRETELLVPLHADLISAVDTEQRQVTMQLPDGLIE